MDEGADAVHKLVAQQAAQIQQLREELEAMKMMREAVTPAPDDQPRPRVAAGSRATVNPLTADQQPGGADDGKAGEEQGDSRAVLDAIPPPLFKLFSAHCAARRGECLLNLHQASVFFCIVKEGVPLWQKLLYLATSLGLVFCQVWAMISIMWSMDTQNCFTHDQCSGMGTGVVCLGGRFDDGSAGCGRCENAYDINGTMLHYKSHRWDAEVDAWDERYNFQCECDRTRVQSSTASVQTYLRLRLPRTDLNYDIDPDMPSLNFSSPYFTCPIKDGMCQHCFDPVSHSRLCSTASVQHNPMLLSAVDSAAPSDNADIFRAAWDARRQKGGESEGHAHGGLRGALPSIHRRRLNDRRGVARCQALGNQRQHSVVQGSSWLADWAHNGASVSPVWGASDHRCQPAARDQRPRWRCS